LRSCAAVSGAVVVIIALFLVLESIPALRNVGFTRWFSDPSWHPKADASQGTFNLVPMLAGTMAAMVGSVLVATPLGIASALFRQFYAPRGLGEAYRRLIELLAGIPSVVYGFWGLVVLVPLIRRIEPPGASLLAGIIILAIMILPTIALTADAAIEAVPKHYLQGAHALGLSRWGILIAIIFPAARSGLFTGVILETGRAIGETMAILMVCGNIVQTPKSLFDPIRTLTANIALEMAYALGDHRSALFVSGLALMMMIVLLAIGAEWFGRENIHAGN